LPLVERPREAKNTKARNEQGRFEIEDDQHPAQAVSAIANRQSAIGNMNDLRFALRQLLKNPGFTAVAVLTLGLGIGANTAIFTLINTILLHPLPYSEPERLVRVFCTSPQSSKWPHSIANFLDQREQNMVFERVAAFRWTHFSVAEPGEPVESLRGIAATADFFPALKANAALGRVFTAEEDQPGRNQVVVISHACWQRRFGGDPNILGRTLRVDGESAAVIGVMPASFEYPLLWGFVEAWRPFAFTAEQRRDRISYTLNVLARLKPGVTFEQGEAAMKTLGVRLAKAFPDTNAGTNLRIAPLRESIGDEAGRRISWLTLGLTGFVLLIACVNLANLQLARATTRTREVAMRLALGAGRGRLIRQLLAESLLLALIGGALGLVLANWSSDFLGSRLMFPGGHRGLAMSLDGRVLLFALLCSTLTGVLFGIAPAWLASRTNLNEVLKTSARNVSAGRSQHRLRHALIIGEIALALVLLTGTGLFIGGLQRFIARDPGWQVDGLLTGWLPLTSPNYSTPEQRRAFVQRLEERLAALPGVERAATSSSLPIVSFGTRRPFIIESRAAPILGQEPHAYAESVGPGYFGTLGIRLREGRLFRDMDTAGNPDVAIINESMARHFWPNENPIGQRIGGIDQRNPGWQEIVGIVNDLRFPANLGTPETRWQIYRPFAQEPRLHVALALRTQGAPENLVPALRRAVAELDADLPVNELEPTRNMVDRLLANFNLVGATLGCFAMLGLVLATVGIYGVISFFVAQRTGEIGIRMALGAQVRDVFWLVLNKGLVLSALGILFGLLGASLVAVLIAAAVPELPATNPLTLAAVILALIVAALLACWLPARRAANVDPIKALRYE
jgi:putative ABC transport system permease protein